MDERDWETWTGVNGLEYARRVRSSPAVVVHAAPGELGRVIQEAERKLNEGNPRSCGTYWDHLKDR